MRRRQFITLLSGAASWPVAAHAQQPAMPVIGYLHSGKAESYRPMVASFRQGLKDLGYVEGQNVAIEFRWAEDHTERLPALAADLVRRRVAAIVASPSPAVIAAKAATSTIPIAIVVGADPVKTGLVASLNRPGGNVTGVAFQTDVLGSKRLALLRELIPQATTIAFLVDPNSPTAEQQKNDVQAAGSTLGLQIVVLEATGQPDFDAVFATLNRHRSGALVVAGSALFTSNRDRIIALAERHNVPAIYQDREFAAAGGLMSYGASFLAMYRQVGVYTGQLLKGANPANLPVQEPIKFDLVVNLKTAKVLGLTIPPNLLAIADEVIE
jgi:putative ABC transport system substrate-binding protein